MSIVLFSLAFLVAALCAGVMGFAIQRGGTCAVAAVEDVVVRGHFGHFFSLFEAALWVAGGLLLAQALHRLPPLAGGYAVSLYTVAGGALLGLGAYINRACVFGTIARFGSGEWAYLASPLGFYVGCVIATRWVHMPGMPQPITRSQLLHAPRGVAFAFMLFVAWRLVSPWQARRRSRDPSTTTQRLHQFLASRIWSHHAATTVIGITFLVMLLAVGAWAYTDFLAELAHGMSQNVAARGTLLLALLAGATWGGWTAGRFHSTRVSVAQTVRCFAGGLLMGWGSLFIPGGNDGLILLAMPLGWAYAWVAFATMCAVIGGAQWLRQHHRRPARSAVSS